MSGRGCGQGGCRGYGIPDARVKGLGKNIVGTELVLGHKGGEGVRRGELHRVVDVRGTHVQRPAENAGEAEHVVDLVRVIRTAGADNGGAARLRLVRENLGHGVGAGKDDGIPIHAADHFRGQHAGGRDPDKDIRPRQHLGQRAFTLMRVGLECQLALGIVHVVRPSVPDRTAAVAEGEVRRAGGHEQAGNGGRGRPGTVNDDADGREVLPDQLQRSARFSGRPA